MPRQPKPFSAVERMIAWRYLRARRAEGGVSVMTWISLVGIALAVFALIATLAVRSGFRAEFVDTILGANAHVTYYGVARMAEDGTTTTLIADASARAAAFAALPGVTGAAPQVRGQVLASFSGRSAGAAVHGMAGSDVERLPRIVDPATGLGDFARYGDGVAIGSGLARSLGIGVGGQVRLLSPDGARTPFGTSPRVGVFEVVYIFSAGRFDIDNTRIYMPLETAQGFFNREGGVDEIEIYLARPEALEAAMPALWQAVPPGEGFLRTWQDASGAFLRALEVEDNVMFVILSVLVLIATMNIVSGLIMLVKNKQADIGILRTMGLSEGGVVRVFLLCGVTVGVVGTAAGVVLGCLFALYIDAIFAAVNRLSGGDVWDPSIRGIYYLPALLQARDVATAVALSLSLSCLVTLLPARRAARLDPVEALRGG